MSTPDQKAPVTHLIENENKAISSVQFTVSSSGQGKKENDGMGWEGKGKEG
jgi:hypothetical protein